MVNKIYCFPTLSLGSGLVSKEKYFHGFFSAAIRLPVGVTSGVVLAFYVRSSFLVK